MTRILKIILLGLLPFLAHGMALAGNPERYSFDVLIAGGKVYDGTGNPWFYADVGIRDGKIHALGNLDGASARKIIDATGKVVTPGFIDIHSHADEPEGGAWGLRDENPRRRAAPNLVSQGITTVVINQCGRSPWPVREQIAELRHMKTGPNVITLVGHGTVRSLVMGEDVRREATSAEIGRMREFVRQGMQDGAMGLSSALEYYPAIWSNTHEVAALVEEIVPYAGVYITHMRSEGTDPMWYWPSQHPPGPPTLIDAVRETIEIGERTGATVVASHIKVKGAHYWGTSHTVINLIEAARQRGVSIWADQYSYTTTGTDGNTILLPPWVFAGKPNNITFAEMLEKVLENPAKEANLRKDISHEILRRGGEEQLIILEHPNPEYVGNSLKEISARRKLSPVDMAIRLQLEGFADRRGGARIRGFSLSEYDVEQFMKQPWVATATDGGIGIAGEDTYPVHPRFYGNHPRKIRVYALERGIISVENAIRSSTSLPAQILGLRNRGMLREGFIADVVVMDLENLRDHADFFNPHQYSTGIEYVLINGEFVVKQGDFTWALPGAVITHKNTP